MKLLLEHSLCYCLISTPCVIVGALLVLLLEHSLCYCWSTSCVIVGALLVLLLEHSLCYNNNKCWESLASIGSRQHVN